LYQQRTLLQTTRKWVRSSKLPLLNTALLKQTRSGREQLKLQFIHPLKQIGKQCYVQAMSVSYLHSYNHYKLYIIVYIQCLFSFQCLLLRRFSLILFCVCFAVPAIPPVHLRIEFHSGCIYWIMNAMVKLANPWSALV